MMPCFAWMMVDMVGPQVEVTVINHLTSDNVAIHWHGVHPPEVWEDGAHGVTQAPIMPGQVDPQRQVGT